jgi:hypothetical protein
LTISLKREIRTELMGGMSLSAKSEGRGAAFFQVMRGKAKGALRFRERFGSLKKGTPVRLPSRGFFCFFEV